jgi:hypothetical protein
LFTEGKSNPIHDTFDTIIDPITQLAGEWIAAFIPESSGMVDIVVEEIITSPLSSRTFSIFAALFKKIPKKFQGLLIQPEILKSFLSEISNTWAKTPITGDAMGIALSDVMVTKFQPNIDKASYVVSIIMPMAFSILVFNDMYSDKNTIMATTKTERSALVAAEQLLKDAPPAPRIETSNIVHVPRFSPPVSTQIVPPPLRRLITQRGGNLATYIDFIQHR